VSEFDENNWLENPWLKISHNDTGDTLAEKAPQYTIPSLDAFTKM
jgi:hypothetical protein